MKAWSNKVKVGIGVLAVAVMMGGVSLASPRQSGSDVESRTVVIQTHHATQRAHVKLPVQKTADTTVTGTTLSGDVEFRAESLG